MSKCYKPEEVSRIYGIEQGVLVEFVSHEWIKPLNPSEFDEEDISRAKLILDLIDDFGVNREGVSIILHLLDQLHFLQREIRKK